jgi:hypothetical protein
VIGIQLSLFETDLSRLHIKLADDRIIEVSEDLVYRAGSRDFALDLLRTISDPGRLKKPPGSGVDADYAEEIQELAVTVGQLGQREVKQELSLAEEEVYRLARSLLEQELQLMLAVTREDASRTIARALRPDSE